MEQEKNQIKLHHRKVGTNIVRTLAAERFNRESQIALKYSREDWIEQGMQRLAADKLKRERAERRRTSK